MHFRALQAAAFVYQNIHVGTKVVLSKPESSQSRKRKLLDTEVELTGFGHEIFPWVLLGTSMDEGALLRSVKPPCEALL